jgi:membrane-associated phospholipid phosphatase
LSQSKLPQVTTENRLLMIVGGFLLFFFLYLGAPFVRLRAPETVPALWLDTIIPFLPTSVWIYLSQYMLAFCAIWCAPEDRTRTAAFYGMLLASAIAAVIFIAFPTELPRMVVEGPVWNALYALDVPGNCFPSLHAALAAISAWALMSAGRVWKAAAPLWAALIIFSTLSTKQHVVLDIAGGLVLALVCNVLVRQSKVVLSRYIRN